MPDYNQLESAFRTLVKADIKILERDDEIRKKITRLNHPSNKNNRQEIKREIETLLKESLVLTEKTLYYKKKIR